MGDWDGSYYIQHFADTFRQSCIDLLQGQLAPSAGHIPEDDVRGAVVGIAATALKPAGPLTYYNYGQCASEHLLLEQVVHSARCAYPTALLFGFVFGFVFGIHASFVFSFH